MSMDTIFALSSARGKAGVAVIRVSGPLATNTAIQLVGRVPKPRQAELRKIETRGAVHLDTALVLFFPKGASYTGEDTVEFQVHGGIATVKSVLATLSCLDGIRLAEAGEFTLQALLNGRLDVSEVEGLGDLIQAETEAQRSQALRLFSGSLGKKVKVWRDSLLGCAALLEVSLDFTDEDLPPETLSQANERLQATVDALQQESRGVKSSERIRDGFEVAIVGAPNTGKSTLLNYLAGREAAITSERAGTTRDVIEVRMDLSGLPVTILDLAGLREALDPIEQIGVQRSLSRATSADIRVFLVDADGLPTNVPDFKVGDIVCRAKADLLAVPIVGSVSGKTGWGVDELVNELVRELEGRAAMAMTATCARHKAVIDAAIWNLESAIVHLANNQATEMAAEDVRQAGRELESLIGYVDTEDVLDRIFSGFCIGK